MKFHKYFFSLLIVILTLACEKKEEVPETPEFTSFLVKNIDGITHTSAIVHLYQAHNLDVIKAGVEVKNIESESRDTFYFTDYTDNYVNVYLSKLIEGTYYECHGFIESASSTEMTEADTFYTIPGFVFDSVLFNYIMTDDTLYVIGKKFKTNKNISGYFNFHQWLINIDTQEIEYTEEDSIKLLLLDGNESGLKFILPAFMEDTLKRGYTTGKIYIWQDNYRYNAPDTIFVYTHHPSLVSIDHTNNGHTLELRGEFGNMRPPLVTIDGYENDGVGTGYVKNAFFHQNYIIEFPVPSIIQEGKHTVTITIDDGYSVSHDVIIDYTD